MALWTPLDDTDVETWQDGNSSGSTWQSEGSLGPTLRQLGANPLPSFTAGPPGYAGFAASEVMEFSSGSLASPSAWPCWVFGVRPSGGALTRTLTSPAAVGSGLQVRIEADGKLGIISSYTAGIASSIGALTDGVDYGIAYAINASTGAWAIWINGVLDNSGTYSGGGFPFAASGSTYVGCNAFGDEKFHGRLYQVARFQGVSNMDERLGWLSWKIKGDGSIAPAAYASAAPTTGASDSASSTIAGTATFAATGASIRAASSTITATAAITGVGATAGGSSSVVAGSATFSAVGSAIIAASSAMSGAAAFAGIGAGVGWTRQALGDDDWTPATPPAATWSRASADTTSWSRS